MGTEEGRGQPREARRLVRRALTGFFDGDTLVIDDPDHSLDEERFVLLGLSSKVRVVTVVHCPRGEDDIIRIISARRATPGEQSSYHAQVRR